MNTPSLRLRESNATLHSTKFNIVRDIPRHGAPARKAAVRAASEAMAALARSDDIAAKVETDLGWHVAVAQASGNRFLVSIMGSIAHALGQHLRMLNDVAGNFEGNLPNHLRVTEAILASDATGARAAMEELVARARDDTRRMRPNPAQTPPD